MARVTFDQINAWADQMGGWYDASSNPSGSVTSTIKYETLDNPVRIAALEAAKQGQPFNQKDLLAPEKIQVRRVVYQVVRGPNKGAVMEIEDIPGVSETQQIYEQVGSGKPPEGKEGGSGGPTLRENPETGTVWQIFPDGTSRDTKVPYDKGGATAPQLKEGEKGTYIAIYPDGTSKDTGVKIAKDPAKPSHQVISTEAGHFVVTITPDGKISQTQISQAPPKNTTTQVSAADGSKLLVTTDKDGKVINTQVVAKGQQETTTVDVDGQKVPVRVKRDANGNVTGYEEVPVDVDRSPLALDNEPDPSFKTGKVVEDLRAYQKYLAGEVSAGRVTQKQANDLFANRGKLAEQWVNEQKALRDDAIREQTNAISRQNSITSAVQTVNSNAMDVYKTLLGKSPGAAKAMLGSMVLQLSMLSATGSLDMPTNITDRSAIDGANPDSGLRQGRFSMSRVSSALTGGAERVARADMGGAAPLADDDEMPVDDRAPAPYAESGKRRGTGTGTAVTNEKRKLPPGVKPQDDRVARGVAKGDDPQELQRVAAEGVTTEWSTRLSRPQKIAYAEWVGSGGDGSYQGFSAHLSAFGQEVSTSVTPSAETSSAPAAGKAAARRARKSAGLQDTASPSTLPNGTVQPQTASALGAAWSYVQAKRAEGDSREAVVLAMEWADAEGKELLAGMAVENGLDKGFGPKDATDFQSLDPQTQQLFLAEYGDPEVAASVWAGQANANMGLKQPKFEEFNQRYREVVANARGAGDTRPAHQVWMEYEATREDAKALRESHIAESSEVKATAGKFGWKPLAPKSPQDYAAKTGLTQPSEADLSHVKFLEGLDPARKKAYDEWVKAGGDGTEASFEPHATAIGLAKPQPLPKAPIPAAGAAAVQRARGGVSTAPVSNSGDTNSPGAAAGDPGAWGDGQVRQTVYPEDVVEVGGPPSAPVGPFTPSDQQDRRDATNVFSPAKPGPGTPGTPFETVIQNRDGTEMTPGSPSPMPQAMQSQLPPPPPNSIQGTNSLLARIAAEAGLPWDDRASEDASMTFLESIGMAV